MPASLINSLLSQSFKAWFPAYTGNLAFNLLGTLAIEIPLAFALGLRGRKNAWAVFEVNVMTNPIVVTILFGLVRTSLSMPVVRVILFLMECAVVGTEGMLYKNRLTGRESRED